MDDIKDIDGTVIRVGDRVSTIYGECVIQEVLLPRNPPADNRFGALLKVKDAKGKTWDLMVKTTNIRLVVYVDPKQKITTSKYGV
jgi:hypothetical protein